MNVLSSSFYSPIVSFTIRKMYLNESYYICKTEVLLIKIITNMTFIFAAKAIRFVVEDIGVEPMTSRMQI